MNVNNDRFVAFVGSTTVVVISVVNFITTPGLIGFVFLPTALLASFLVGYFRLWKFL